MSSIPKLGPLGAINGFVDRAIGASELEPSVRAKLLRQQLGSVERMMPALLAASLVLSAVLVTLSWGQARFLPLAVATGSLCLMQAYGVYLGRVMPPENQDVPLGSAVGRSLFFPLLGGALWGLVFNILPVAQSDMFRAATTIGAVGMLCVAMLAFVHYPQALALFFLSLMIGALSNIIDLSSIADIWVQASLIGSFSFIMVTVSLSHAASFVAYRGSEVLVQEKREIIGLLLREFEQSASDWIWGFDPNGNINRMSGGFTAATGLTDDVLIGADFIYFLRCITTPDDPIVERLVRDVADHATFQDVEIQVTADGEECWWSLTGKPAFDEHNTYLGYIGTGSNITQRRIAERRITMLAHHDPMTGLLNRTKFTDQLNSAVARLERYGTAFAVMFLDLDHFKSVNDTRGHMTGDKLLVAVAKRIQHQLRETDLPARLGGDEFAILLLNDCHAERLAALAGRLIEAIGQPYQIDGEQLNIGVSIGIAMAPLNGTRPDQILRNADLALYRSKADGRSEFRFFESQMDSEARERRLLEVELRDAVGNGELVLHYQPLIATKDGSTVGFEALIRWNHPIRGLVPPAEFIPLAEQSQLIVDIGDWTIEEACATATLWPSHLTVAVNLSAKHFQRSDIALVVQRALARSGLSPHRLEIEITEGLLMDKPEEVTQKLAAIRALGVTIAMDDFGTGYSSLSYLLKFPFDKIKIDRSFVDASSSGEVARDILKAIATLGKTLKVKITAEGVETQEQAQFLAAIACHQLQGFYFSRPLDQSELAAYLANRLGPGQGAAALRLAS